MPGKAKNKMLPKDFEQLLKAGDLATRQAVFETCDVNARGGYAKQTALAFDGCPDALARWLVSRRADLSAVDTQQRGWVEADRGDEARVVHERARSAFESATGVEAGSLRLPRGVAVPVRDVPDGEGPGRRVRARLRVCG